MDDQPGVTRDRISALCQWHDRAFILIDTGGWSDDSDEDLTKQVTKQIERAFEQAEIFLLVVDGSLELTALDEMLASVVRTYSKPVALIVNKSDLKRTRQNLHDCYKLGFDPVIPVSATHGEGIEDIFDFLRTYIQPQTSPVVRVECSFAVLGRPNVGKSTFVNCLLGDERITVHDAPGTTRDPIDTHFQWYGHSLSLIDTAGIRRQARQEDRIERWSSQKALQSLARSDFALLIMDAVDGITDGDLKVAQYIAEAYKPAMIIMNKWDLIEQQTQYARTVRADIRERMHFLAYAPLVLVSAQSGLRMSLVLSKAWSIFSKLPVSVNVQKLNLVLKDALRKHPPPRRNNRAIDVGPISMVSGSPPIFLIKCSDPGRLEPSYQRYLHRLIVAQTGITQLPIRLVFKTKARKR